MIWFTSDLHLGHRSVISMQKRPFLDVEEMNRVLIDNYNTAVCQDDTVYILGDLCYRMRVGDANDIISGLNGKKYLIKGNHDKNYDPGLFCDVRDFM